MNPLISFSSEGPLHNLSLCTGCLSWCNRIQSLTCKLVLNQCLSFLPCKQSLFSSFGINCNLPLNSTSQRLVLNMVVSSSSVHRLPFINNSFISQLQVCSIILQPLLNLRVLKIIRNAKFNYLTKKYNITIYFLSKKYYVKPLLCNNH